MKNLIKSKWWMVGKKTLWITANFMMKLQMPPTSEVSSFPHVRFTHKNFILIFVLDKKHLFWTLFSHQNQRIARCRSLESVHYIISDHVSAEELIKSDFYVLTFYINSAAALFGQSLRWRPTWATSSSSTPSASPFPSPSSSSPTRSSSRQSGWGYVLCVWQLP